MAMGAAMCVILQAKGRRPLGPGGGEGDILFQEGRAHAGGPCDVNQQRGKSLSRQMALTRPAVKAGWAIRSDFSLFAGRIGAGGRVAVRPPARIPDR